MTDKLRDAAQAALLALDSDHPDIQLRAAMNLRAALAKPAIKESLTGATSFALPHPGHEQPD